MSTLATVAGDIRQQFETAWQAGPNTKIAWDNVEFDPTGETEWVRVALLPGDAFPAAIGPSAPERNAGVVVVQVFTERGTGAGRADELAEEVKKVFRGAPLAGVRFRVATEVAADRGEGRWYQRNVQVPFQADVVPA